MIASKDTKFVSTERYSDSTRSRVHRALCWVLIAGNIGFGLLALVMPKRIGALIDEDEDAVRRIARKDLAAGIALASSRGRPLIPLAMNAVADVREGAGWLKSKPMFALVPLAWAGLAIAAILTRGEKAAS